MSGSGTHWKLGLFVLLGVAAGVGALLAIGASRFDRRSVPAVTYFDESVQGLEVGSPVKFRGVTVGAVKEIRVAPDRQHIEVNNSIYLDALERLGLVDPGQEIRDGEGEFVRSGVRVQVATAGITGVRFLELDFFDPEERPLPELDFQTPWNYIPSTPSMLKGIETRFVESLDRLPGLLDELRGLAASARGQLDRLQLDAVSQSARSFFDRGTETLAAVDAAKLSAELEAALVEARLAARKMNELLEALGSDDGAVGRALGRVETLSGDLGRAVDEADLPGTTAAVRRAADSVELLMRDTQGVGSPLRSSLEELDRALRSLRDLVDLLERDPGVLLRGRGEERDPFGE